MFETVRQFLRSRQSTDLELNYIGQKVLNQIGQKDFSPQDILQIQSNHGYDVACWALYKAFKEKAPFKEFNSFVESRSQFYSKDHSKYVVFVMSHNPWVSRAQNNDYQWRLKNIFADAGFDVCFPEIQYRRSLFPNAYYYQGILKRFAGRKVIFVSHSLAGLEVRWLLERSVQLQVEPVGWLNLSGLLYGTSLPPAQDTWFSVKRYWKDEHPVSPEVLRSNAYCYKPFQGHETLPMVSVLGIRPSRYFQFRETFRDQELRFWGPHDGFITLTDYLQNPDVVWPLWGEGHYLDVEIYKKRLQASLVWLIQTQEKRTADRKRQAELSQRFYNPDLV